MPPLIAIDVGNRFDEFGDIGIDAFPGTLSPRSFDSVRPGSTSLVRGLRYPRGFSMQLPPLVNTEKRLEIALPISLVLAQ